MRIIDLHGVAVEATLPLVVVVLDDGDTVGIYKLEAKNDDDGMICEVN